MFCMFYALVGIPLNLVMFQSIGERLNVFTTFLLERLLRAVRRALKSSTGDGVTRRGCCRLFTLPDHIGTTHLIVVSMNVSTLVVAGGAWVFSRFENWSYLNSVYYCVITLTTVGFGDMVALQQDHVLQQRPDLVVFSVFFILFGLAVVSAAMNLLVLRFLTMNTEDERRDEELRILAQQQLHHQQQLNNLLSGDVTAAVCLDNIKVVASTPTLTTPSTNNQPSTSTLDALSVANGTASVVEDRKQRLRLTHFIDGDSSGEEECWRRCWWKLKPGMDRCRSAPYPTLSTAPTTSYSWQQAQSPHGRYHLKRPSPAIDHLLLSRPVDDDSTRSNGRLANYFRLSMPPSSVYSSVNRVSSPMTLGSYVDRGFSDVATRFPSSSVCNKRTSI